MTPGTRVLAATILGSSMASIDGSVVNVALPAIQGGFGSRHSGVASGINNAVARVAGLLAVGVLAAAGSDAVAGFRLVAWAGAACAVDAAAVATGTIGGRGREGA
jgi:hypothetical protein